MSDSPDDHKLVNRPRQPTNPRLPTPSKTVLISENASSHMQRVLSDPDMLSQLSDLAALEGLAVRVLWSSGRQKEGEKEKNAHPFFFSSFFVL